MQHQIKTKDVSNEVNLESGEDEEEEINVQVIHCFVHIMSALGGGGCPIRKDPFITFARGGGEEGVNFANDNTDRLREIQTKGRDGTRTQKYCKRNKWKPPK